MLKSSLYHVAGVGECSSLLGEHNLVTQKPTAIDLFSGCGGLTLGLKQAGFRVIAAVESDALAVKTYKSNHPRVHVCQDDIRKIAARTLMVELGIKEGQLDLLAGCPPCQGFSVLRTRNGAAQNRDQRNGLIDQMLRFARAFRPKAIMLENVPGLVSRRPFRELCRDLSRLGYRVQWDVKDARHYHVPQRRKRLILLAGRGFEIPFPGKQNRRNGRSEIRTRAYFCRES
jgi:DNA (cytosine-5)-methyltransferase 1